MRSYTKAGRPLWAVEMSPVVVYRWTDFQNNQPEITEDLSGEKNNNKKLKPLGAPLLFYQRNVSLFVMSSLTHDV